MQFTPDIPGRFYRTDERVPGASKLWDQIVENGMSSMVEYNKNVVSKSVGGTIATVLLAINLVGVFVGIFLKNGTLTGILIASFLMLMCLSILIVRDPSKNKSELKRIRFVVAVFLGIIVIGTALFVLGMTGTLKLQPVTYCRVAAAVCLAAAAVVGVWIGISTYRTNSMYSYSGTATVVGYEDRLYFARRKLYRDVLTTPIYEICHGGNKYLVYGDREYLAGGSSYAMPHIGSSQTVFYDPFDPCDCIFAEQNKVPNVIKGVVAFFVIAALCAFFASMALG